MPNFTPEGNIYVYFSWLAHVLQVSLCTADLPWLSDSPKYRLTFRDFFLRLLSLYLLLEGLEVNLPNGLCSSLFPRPSHSLRE